MPGRGKESVANYGLDTLLENMKAMQDASSVTQSKSQRRLFGRERPVREILGGGHSADVLLWKKKHLSAGFLAGSTTMWILFAWIECHLVSLAALAALATLIFLFAWSNYAAILNRPPPPVPNVEVSDEAILDMVKLLRTQINRALSMLHNVAVGKDVKLFVKVALGLWLLSVLGGWFNFVTLLYLGVIFAHTVPAIYDKNEDAIDKYIQKLLDELQNRYKTVDVAFLSRIPNLSPKQKKRE
eukprot:c24401_g1_i1 orf=319-1044(-)